MALIDQFDSLDPALKRWLDLIALALIDDYIAERGEKELSGDGEAAPEARAAGPGAMATSTASPSPPMCQDFSP